VGRSDFDAVLKTTSMDRMLRAFAFDAELTATWRLPGASRAVGHPVDKVRYAVTRSHRDAVTR
jgi:hypothetical protein